MQLSDLVEYLGGYITHHQELNVFGIASLASAKSDQISFLSKDSFKKNALDSEAGAVICKEELPGKVCIVVDDPYLAYARAAQFFHPREIVSGKHIHQAAVIEDGVELPLNIKVGSGSILKKGCKIEDGVCIGSNTIIEGGVHLGQHTHLDHNVVVYKDCILGEYCCIGSGSVIGGQGFGHASNNSRWEKIPQIGRVVIGDRVDIGYNVCIDRGALDDTKIENDVILDNLIHIAHNCFIGEGTAVAGQNGFAGGVIVGKRCKFGGQCGFNSNIVIADDVTILGKSLVPKSIKKAGIYAGDPVMNVREWKKNTVLKRNLNAIYERVVEVEKKIESKSRI